MDEIILDGKRRVNRRERKKGEESEKREKESGLAETYTITKNRPSSKKYPLPFPDIVFFWLCFDFL